MAYFQRHNGKVRVYYHDKTTGRVKSLSRDKIKHLDPLTDDDIRQWIDSWEDDSGVSRSRSRDKAVLSTDELAILFDSYQEQRRQLRNISDGTLYDERTFWTKHVLPYFVVKNDEKNPRRWAAYTSSFTTYLKQKGTLSTKSIKQAGWLLERFGKHLASIGVIQSPWFVPQPILNRKATTPLKLNLTPADILKVADQIKGKYPTYTIALLLGFFASLRPGETFALSKEDFLTGDKAKAMAKTYSRFHAVGLGSGLSVSITKALDDKGIIGNPKTHHSYGYVNVWNVEAAKMLAELVKVLPAGRIFNGHKTWLFKSFGRALKGKLDVTPHDLRRASALYLGRTLGIEIMLLQDHMRHSDIQTTMIYTRRPLEETTVNEEQDFGDVS